MKTRLAGLKHHFIICGLGRVGREVAEAIQRESMQFIVVDRDPLAIAEADELGYLYVQGDATLDEVLISAGIKSARGLVAAAGSDSDNVFITLSAKGLNSSLTVVARATNTQTEDKLLIAGASKVILPYRIGGRRMAMSALRPLAVDFFDSIFNSDGEKGLRLAEIQVADRSPLAGLTIEKCVSDQGIQVLALRRGDDEMIVNPKGDVVLKPGDGLVLVGHNSQLEPLEREDRS